MGRNRRKAPATPTSPQASKRASSVPRAASARGTTRFAPARGRLLARLVLATLVPALLLLATEGVLRLAGYGYPTSFWIPTPDGRALRTNPRFGLSHMSRETATQPVPAVVTPAKPPGTLRVVVLGESAAQGTPAPAFGFARILEVLLERQFPSNRIEIVNAAMRGINSHAIRRIALDCAPIQPDLFLVYMGNNEHIGLHSPEPHGLNLTSWRRFLRVRQWLLELRLGQLVANTMRSVGGSSPGRKEQDMAFFREKRLAADHPRKAAVYDNFRAHLEDICRAAAGMGARTIVATVAVNLRDCPPIASLHRDGLSADDLAAWEQAWKRGIEAEAAGRWTEAVASFSEARRMDDHFAELHFRLGRSLLGAGQPAPARGSFTEACRWDALQFRTDPGLNAIVREVAASRADERVRLLDVEVAFAASPDAEPGIPGERLFHEHVHFTFDGDYLLARTFAPAVAEALGLGSPAGPVPTRTECGEALGFTEWDELGVRAAIARLTAHAPFLDQADHAVRQQRIEAESASRMRTFQQTGGPKRTLAAYRAAVQRRPGDWHLRLNFADALADFGDAAAATEQYRAAVENMPVSPKLRVSLAQSFWKNGRKPEAIAELEEALRLDPACGPARDGLRELAGPGARGR